MTSEEQIERRVERMTDYLDACLMSGVMSQRDYDGAMRELGQWAAAAADRAAIWDRVQAREAGK
jgi:hypothetical protein